MPIPSTFIPRSKFMKAYKAFDTAVNWDDIVMFASMDTCRRALLESGLVVYSNGIKDYHRCSQPLEWLHINRGVLAIHLDILWHILADLPSSPTIPPDFDTRQPWDWKDEARYIRQVLEFNQTDEEPYTTDLTMAIYFRYWVGYDPEHEEGDGLAVIADVLRVMASI